MSPGRYYVYILTNSIRTVLYIGVTNDPFRRVWQPRNKALPGFTSRYNVNRLIHFEVLHDIRDAIGREKQIKGWSRAKKVGLIVQQNPQWNDLSAGWFQ
jgi:putative endonuclease